MIGPSKRGIDRRAVVNSTVAIGRASARRFGGSLALLLRNFERVAGAFDPAVGPSGDAPVAAEGSA